MAMYDGWWWTDKTRIVFLVMSWILLLHIRHVIMVSKVVNLCFIVHHIDGAGVAHSDVVAGLQDNLYKTCMKFFLTYVT